VLVRQCIINSNDDLKKFRTGYQKSYPGIPEEVMSVVAYNSFMPIL